MSGRALPITCRGRNGYFQLDYFDVFTIASSTHFVTFQSKQPYRNTAPISFSGEKEDLLLMFKQIVADLEGKDKQKDYGWDKEHPDYPRADWRYEVYNRDTCLGYNTWVAHQVESNSN